MKRSTYALSLDHAVDEGTSEAGHDLLGLLVALRLAIALAVLLVGLRSLVRGGSGDKLVGERSFVGSFIDLTMDRIIRQATIAMHTN